MFPLVVCVLMQKLVSAFKIRLSSVTCTTLDWTRTDERNCVKTCVPPLSEPMTWSSDTSTCLKCTVTSSMPCSPICTSEISTPGVRVSTKKVAIALSTAFIFSTVLVDATTASKCGVAPWRISTFEPLSNHFRLAKSLSATVLNMLSREQTVSNSAAAATSSPLHSCRSNVSLIVSLQWRVISCTIALCSSANNALP
uniref:Putative secreted protein n=1 Tax=Anopheles darlingi TaxID=43151 RepID=A0A2M4D7Y1_ANODA